MENLKFRDGEIEKQFVNQKSAAHLFGVSVNAFSGWGLPHAYREGRDVFYDWGVTMVARFGQLSASQRELKLSGVEELALGWLPMESPDQSPISQNAVGRFGRFAKRAGFDRDAAILALGIAIRTLGMRIRG